jgi:hypothetical protein
MAANLNKKYFGNRNIGTGGDQTTGNQSNSQNYSDDRIGGEGIASINWSTLGSFQGNSNVVVLTVPALPAPTLPGGVQATYTAQFEVESVGTGSGKTNLAVGDTFGVASVPGMIAKVTDLSGANAVFSVIATGAARGDALALADIPKDTVGITLTKIAGTGTAGTFFVDIAFRVKESTVTITEKGSGYTGNETFTFTKPGTTNGTVPAGTIVLTTDNGIPYNANNQENAIIPYAYVTGGSRQVADIIRQVGARRYKVRTATGVMTCSLVTDGVANAAGEMDLTAYDSDGGEYWVKKLGGHRCTVVRKASNGGTQFATDSSVPWTFGSAVEDLSVKINNA